MEVMEVKYELPENVYRDWDGYALESFQPNDRQKQVIDAVQAALDHKHFYSSDVLAYVSARLGVTEEQRAIGASKVEGGHVGMDCYYARRYIEARQAARVEKARAQQLGAFVGMQLGTLIFNDFKRTTGVEVVEVLEAGRELSLRGKRGRATVVLRCNATSVACAIDRAAERKARKDRFEDFCQRTPRPLRQFRPGQPCEVLTYGLGDSWNRATFARHQPATPTSLELYHFTGQHGTFVVRADEVATRVRTLD